MWGEARNREARGSRVYAIGSKTGMKRRNLHKRRVKEKHNLRGLLKNENPSEGLIPDTTPRTVQGGSNHDAGGEEKNVREWPLSRKIEG